MTIFLERKNDVRLLDTQIFKRFSEAISIELHAALRLPCRLLELHHLFGAAISMQGLQKKQCHDESPEKKSFQLPPNSITDGYQVTPGTYSYEVSPQNLEDSDVIYGDVIIDIGESVTVTLDVEVVFVSTLIVQNLTDYELEINISELDLAIIVAPQSFSAEWQLPPGIYH